MKIRIHNSVSWFRVGAAMYAAAVATALALVPEPDAVVYGGLFHRFNQPLIPSSPGEVSVIAQLNGATIASTVVTPGANYFLLRIPMDDGIAPRLPNTASPGDTLRLMVSNTVTGVVFDTGQICTLPAERGPVMPKDLTVDANVAGVAPDSNGDGIPDYWAAYFGFSPTAPIANADTDGDGVSNYSEFVAGTNPLDPQSRFALGVALGEGAPAKLNLTFGPVKTYRRYTILVSDSPAGPWTEAETIQPLSGEPQTLAVPIDETAPARFFRILIR
ncbi:MAG: thrombospondin type 3 repeat-containing protein [Verrucomicrobiae bacterium]|nr:thrombospondin type 3 repeat-containing protein [Verrucomicrobiae bacterium]MDW7979984.1 thrombospondin type 3 repeat-containing protein [Verrucomicrobiales bacterium]